MKGRRISHFGGKGRLFLLMFGYESETAKHLFVSEIYSIAAQSFPFKVQIFFFFFFYKHRWQHAINIVPHRPQQCDDASALTMSLLLLFLAPRGSSTAGEAWGHPPSFQPRAVPSRCPGNRPPVLAGPRGDRTGRRPGSAVSTRFGTLS